MKATDRNEPKEETILTDEFKAWAAEMDAKDRRGKNIKSWIGAAAVMSVCLPVIIWGSVVVAWIVILVPVTLFVFLVVYFLKSMFK